MLEAIIMSTKKIKNIPALMSMPKIILKNGVSFLIKIIVMTQPVRLEYMGTSQQ